MLYRNFHTRRVVKGAGIRQAAIPSHKHRYTPKTAAVVMSVTSSKNQPQTVLSYGHHKFIHSCIPSGKKRQLNGVFTEII
jgi:hypothetical protein